MSGYVQSNYVVSMPVQDQTLSAGDSGKIFLLPDLGVLGPAHTLTLPALSPGLHYIFLNASMVSAFNWVITSGGNNNTGTLVRVGVAVASAAAAGGNINIIGGTSVIGDCVEVFSAGTKWCVRATSGAGAGITVT